MTTAKLVRDRIPAIIRESGLEPLIRIAPPDEYRRLIRAKLLEEAEEFLASDDPLELADILEVVLAPAADCGIDRHQLEELRLQKEMERGAFHDRLVWMGNEVRETPGQ